MRGMREDLDAAYRALGYVLWVNVDPYARTGRSFHAMLEQLNARKPEAAWKARATKTELNLTANLQCLAWCCGKTTE